MENLRTINEILENNKDIISSRPVGVRAVVELVAGVLALCLCCKLNGVAGSAAIFVGATLVILGLIGVIGRKRRIVYVPTGERIRVYEIYCPMERKREVVAAVKAGNVARIEEIGRCAESSTKVVIYLGEKGGFMAYQFQTYVPHTYVPLEPAEIDF